MFRSCCRYHKVCSLYRKPPYGFTLFSYSKPIFLICHSRLPPPIEKFTESFPSPKPGTEGASESTKPSKKRKKRNKKKNKNKQAEGHGEESNIEADKVVVEKNNAIIDEDIEEGGGVGLVDNIQPRSLRLRLDLRQQKIVSFTAVPVVPPSSKSPSLPLRLRLSFSPTANTVCLEEWSAEILEKAFPTELKTNRRASG